jgi:hypothetical protein
MTAELHAPTAHCIAEDKLKQAAYSLKQMLGSKIFDLGGLLNMMTIDECDDHKPAGVDRGARPLVVKTASRPLSLDPQDSYYRPPYTGRD